jgi:hypothetical protein
MEVTRAQRRRLSQPASALAIPQSVPGSRQGQHRGDRITLVDEKDKAMAFGYMTDGWLSVYDGRGQRVGDGSPYSRARVINHKNSGPSETHCELELHVLT